MTPHWNKDKPSHTSSLYVPNEKGGWVPPCCSASRMLCTLGSEAAGTTTGRQSSIQVTIILEVLCMLFESLSECHFRCGEKLKWKLLHQNISCGGGTAWKNPNYFKEQREVDERI